MATKTNPLVPGILNDLTSKIEEVRNSSWYKGKGPEHGPKRAVVQQLAAMQLQKLHDADGYTFLEISRMVTTEEGVHPTAERMRALYHKLVPVDVDLRGSRRNRRAK